ncbi:MAG TPA: hypothetical protein VN416_00470, partial [Desulfomonilia bacterium]|nr:hypothetical protein [Desulfomonilia bacterium]
KRPMDKQFLEFWGNMMLSASKGQQQLEDIMKWMTGNVKDFKDVSGMFCKMYGIEPGGEHAPDYLALWQKAINEFKDSYGELVALMDLVPRKDFIALNRENQDLKKRNAELEEAVRHFRSLLDDKVASPAEGVKGFQELINDQARQYQDFMKSVTSVFDERSKTASAKPKTPEPAKAKPKAAKKPARSGAKAGK